MGLEVVLTGIVKSLAIEQLKNWFCGPKEEGLRKKLEQAIEQAAQEFYAKYGTRFGTSTTSFLARKENEDYLLQALYASADEADFSGINPFGFEEAAEPASREALGFFFSSLQHHIRNDIELDRIFEEKRHHAQQRFSLRTLQAVEARQIETHARLDNLPTREDIDQIKSSLDVLIAGQMGRIVETSSARGPNIDPLEEELHAQLDECRELIKANRPHTALTRLQSLKDRHWVRASDQVRFRIETNMGAALLNSGEEEAAAGCFLNAHSFDPDSEKALCNSATAYLLLHQPEQGMQFARKAAALFPNSTQPFIAIVSAAMETPSIDSPVPLVPEPMRERPEVALQISEFFRKRDNKYEYRRWIEKAFSLDGSQSEIQQSMAYNLLEQVVEDKAVIVSRQVTPDQLGKLSNARDLFNNLWISVKESELGKRYIHLAINLSTALRLLGEHQQAIQVLEEASRLAPDDPQVVRQRFFLAIDEGHPKDAAGILAEVADTIFPGKKILEAEALCEAGEFSKALPKIIDLLGGEADPQALPFARILHVQVINQLQGKEAALAEARKYLAEHPSNLQLLVYTATLLTKQNPADALDLVRQAEAMLGEPADYAETSVVADGYFNIDEFHDALRLYRQLIVTTNEDSKVLQRLLSCLLRIDERNEARTTLEGLPSDVLKKPFFCKAAADLYQRTGELAKARVALERYLEQCRDDLNARLWWINILERQGDLTSVSAFLGDLSERPLGSAEDLMALAHILDHHGFQERAWEIAYRILRGTPPDQNLHIGYISLFLFSRGGKSRHSNRILRPRDIGVDTAFTVNCDGKQSTYIIENSEGANVFGEVIALEHPLAQRARGLRKGDNIVLVESSVKREVGKIVEIKHKFLHALHEIMGRLESRFPEQNTYLSLPLSKDAAGNLDLQPLLKVIGEGSQCVKRVWEQYRKQPLPIACLGGIINHNPIDLWVAMMGRDAPPIPCCAGNSEEMGEAISVAHNANGFAVDPLTLFSYHMLGIQEEILASGRLGIVQSTLDLYHRLLLEKRQFSGDMRVWAENGQFFRQDVSKQDKESTVRFLENLLAWVNANCELLPAVASGGVSDDFKEVCKSMDKAFEDTLLAASGSGWPILSDDMFFRQFGTSLVGVKGVWSQVLLNLGLEREQFSKTRFHQITQTMIEANYYFITFDAEHLLFLAKEADWDVSPKIHAALARLGHESVNIRSALVVAAFFIWTVWNAPIDVWRKERLTFAVINGMVENHWGQAEEVVFRLAFLVTARWVFKGRPLSRLNSLRFRNAIMRWFVGHFLPIPPLLNLPLV